MSDGSNCVSGEGDSAGGVWSSAELLVWVEAEWWSEDWLWAVGSGACESETCNAHELTGESTSIPIPAVSASGTATNPGAAHNVVCAVSLECGCESVSSWASGPICGEAVHTSSGESVSSAVTVTLSGPSTGNASARHTGS